jgi:hypothetical protein
MTIKRANGGGLGGSGSPGGALGSFYDHTINQSLRLDDTSGAYLTISSASPTATDRKKVTVSCWVKRSQITHSGVCTIFHGTGNGLMMQFLATDQMYLYESPWQIISDRLFRDAGAWMHIALILDSTQSTDSNRSKLYINGELQDLSTWTIGSGANRYPALNYSFAWHTGSTMRIGSVGDASDLGGYLADFISIDGQDVSISDLGETKDGVWVPKDVSGLTLGDAGFYLKFDNSSDIGNDSGSNNIDFTASNIVATDVVPDSPTNNFATLIPMANTSLSEGNLKMTTSRTGNWDGTIGSFGVTSGKWYYEVRMSATEGTFRCVAGWQGNQASQTVTYHGNGANASPYGTLFDNYQVSSHTTSFYKDGGTDGTTTAPSSGDVINVAADFDNGKIYFGINGTYYANDGGTDGDPAGGTNESMSGIDLTASEYVPAFHIRSDSSAGGNVMIVNFGQEGTFAVTETAGGNSDATGVGNFFSAVPSGFLALASSNLPQPTISPNATEQADDYFNTVLWSGDGTTRSITGVGFQPDFCWHKGRNDNRRNMLYDSVRGATEVLITDSTNAEATATDTLTSFDSDGFSVGGNLNTNYSGKTYVGWNWKAGTAFSNDASATSIGTIDSAGSVSQDAGFSIITYTGNLSSSGTASVAHGLGVRPDMVIYRSRNVSGGDDGSWSIWHDDLSSDNHILRFSSAAESDKSGNGDMASLFTTTTFGTNYTAGLNVTGNNYVAYVFANVDGYSKVGSYVGNGDADGTFIYTGFRPAWIMMKVAVGGTGNWFILDATRSAFNEADDRLDADNNNAEGTGNSDIDFLSNGIKIRTASTAGINQTGDTHIYLAFAEAPFKFANAR